MHKKCIVVDPVVVLVLVVVAAAVVVLKKFGAHLQSRNPFKNSSTFYVCLQQWSHGDFSSIAIVSGNFHLKVIIFKVGLGLNMTDCTLSFNKDPVRKNSTMAYLPSPFFY